MAPGIEIHVPADLRELYEVHEYHHAAALLDTEFPSIYEEVCDVLRVFRLSKSQLLENGGSRGEIPKTFSRLLRAKGWNKRSFNASLVINDKIVQQDTHQINYIKGRAACDLQWNSKDLTFCKNLFAFRTLFDYDKISVGVLVTRSERLNPVLRDLGIGHKYGVSTIHVGKLLSRFKTDCRGSCPLLVFGITEMLLEN